MHLRYKPSEADENQNPLINPSYEKEIRNLQF